MYYIINNHTQEYQFFRNNMLQDNPHPFDTREDALANVNKYFYSVGHCEMYFKHLVDKYFTIKYIKPRFQKEVT